jgi:hypothetical protein
MKKLAVSVTLAAATLASSSAAFADEINTDVVTTDKQAQPAPPPPPVTGTTSSVTTSQTTTTSAPITTPIDRASYTLKENRRPNRPLLITGGSIFVGTYATTVIATAANDSKPDQSLYIPVVGPWLHLADRDGNEGSTGQTLLIGASGVGQGLGVAIMIASMIIPEKRSVGTISAGPVKMTIGPGGAAGTF